MTMRRAVGLLAGAIIAFVVLACSADRAPSPPAAVTDSPSTPQVVESGGASDAARPPPAAASYSGTTIALSIGSYCWSEPGKTAICVDSIGPVTGSIPLTVPPGATVTVPNPVSATAITAANVTAWSGLSSRPIQDGEQVWILGAGVSLLTGRYVVDIGLTYPQGGVSYGLLLDVR
jgi:hypothetical protein